MELTSTHSGKSFRFITQTVKFRRFLLVHDSEENFGAHGKGHINSDSPNYQIR